MHVRIDLDHSVKERLYELSIQMKSILNVGITNLPLMVVAYADTFQSFKIRLVRTFGVYRRIHVKLQLVWYGSIQEYTIRTTVPSPPHHQSTRTYQFRRHYKHGTINLVTMHVSYEI